MWCAAIDEARACYGAQDGGDWRLLESQIERHLGQDERSCLMGGCGARLQVSREIGLL